MLYRFYFLIAVICVAACSNHDLQTGNNPLDGKWRITKVTCNGEESTALSGATLESDITSYVMIGGANASRLWTYYGCQVSTEMTPFSYAPNNTVTAKDGSAVCGTGCAGTEPFCTNPTAGRTLTYGWRLEGGSFVLTLPQTAVNGANPCGAGQGTDKVEFTYKRD